MKNISALELQHQLHEPNVMRKPFIHHRGCIARRKLSLYLLARSTGRNLQVPE